MKPEARAAHCFFSAIPKLQINCHRRASWKTERAVVYYSQVVYIHDLSYIFRCCCTPGCRRSSRAKRTQQAASKFARKIHAWTAGLSGNRSSIRFPSHLAVQHGVRLGEKPLPAGMVVDRDALEPRVHLENRRAAVCLAQFLEVRACSRAPCLCVGEGSQGPPRVVRALRLQDFSVGRRTRHFERRTCCCCSCCCGSCCCWGCSV